MAVCLLALVVSLDRRGRRSRVVYTNDDLDRLAPLRGQTGVLRSRPSHRRSPRAAVSDGSGRDERYWRQQADRSARRTGPEAARAGHGAGGEESTSCATSPACEPYSDRRVRALEQKRQALEERAREAEPRLEERARRAGAMPGWLR